MGGIKNQRKNRNYPDCNVVKNSENSQKSPGDLRKLEETCCHLDSRERLLANAGGRNSQITE